MAGSNDYVLKMGASGSEVVVSGQLDGTMALNGAPVETTNKASGGYIEYLAGFVAGKQVAFSGTFTLLNTADQLTLKNAIENGTQIAGIVETGTGGESWQCDTWSISGRSDAAPLNGIPQMSLTISTSGAYVYTAPA
jgi:hypothetical protein